MQKSNHESSKKNIPLINLEEQQKLIRKDIDQAIKKVLDHGSYIMGPEVYELELELAAFSQTKHAIACSSGTDALLLALLAKDINVNDVVYVPSFTFSATAEVVALLNAIPIFVDVDETTFNIDLQSLHDTHEKVIAKGFNPVGVISVDMFGQPCDYHKLNSWVQNNKLWLIDDAAQSFGATYQKTPIGNFGDIATTSFYPSKPLGCYGDGGCVFTNNDSLAEKIRSFRVHGEGVSKYDNLRVGLNARMDTIQAAILLEKLKIFPEELIQRNQTAALYTKYLESTVQVPKLSYHVTSSWAQYTVKVDPEIRTNLRHTLQKKGISTCVYYPIPLHKQPAYQKYADIIDNNLVQSERLSKSVLSLPLGCSTKDVEYIVEEICEAVALEVCT